MKKDKNVLDKPNLANVLEVGGGGGWGQSFVFRGTQLFKNLSGFYFYLLLEGFLKNFG